MSAGRFHSEKSFFPLEDWTEPWRSIEWDISRHFFNKKGRNAFVGAEKVPFLATCDGSLATATAQFLHEFTKTLRRDGERSKICLVEFGAGSGLYSRLLLNALASRAAEDGGLQNSRGLYIITDSTSRMLSDINQTNIPNEQFALNLEALTLLPPYADLDSFVERLNENSCDVVCFIANYIFDNLPFDIYRQHGQTSEQLFVRTHLARNRYTRNVIRKVSENNGAITSTEFDSLVLLAPFLNLHCEFRAPSSWKGGEISVPPSPDGPIDGILNWGAFDVLARIASLMRKPWILLLSDYAARPLHRLPEVGPYQRFGASVAAGIDFDALKEFVTRNLQISWVEPAVPWPSLKSTLMGTYKKEKISKSFADIFSRNWYEGSFAPAIKARAMVRRANYGAASSYYLSALVHQPFNWTIYEEAAGFALKHLNNPALALDLVQRALTLNPDCASTLWVLAGDARALQKDYSAIDDYMRALTIDANDYLAHISLARWFQRGGSANLALQHCAKAISCGPPDAILGELTKIHTEIISEIRHRQRSQTSHLKNRYLFTESLQRLATTNPSLKEISSSSGIEATEV